MPVVRKGSKSLNPTHAYATKRYVPYLTPEVKLKGLQYVENFTYRIQQDVDELVDKLNLGEEEQSLFSDYILKLIKKELKTIHSL